MKSSNEVYPIRPWQIVFIGDIFLIIAGLFSALFVRYRIFSIIEFPVAAIILRSSIHLGTAILFWQLFRMPKRVIRHFHSDDYLRLILAVFLMHAASYSIRVFIPAKYHFGLTTWVISFFITTMYLLLSRLIINYLFSYYENIRNKSRDRRLLIYGAGELGITLKKSLDTHNSHSFRLVGFLDDDPVKIGQYIRGTRIYDADKGLHDIIIKNRITDIIIASKLLTPARKSKFLQDTIMFNIRVREIPPIKKWFDSNFNLESLSTIDIKDLLSREPIQLYNEQVEKGLHKKLILVTGAAGSIGSEIVRKLAQHHAANIICLDFAESALYDLQQEMKESYPDSRFHFVLADIRDSKYLHEVFEKYRPHMVFHAAAYKHVPLMEDYPWQAIQTNVLATYRLAQLAGEFEVEKFVFISTDKAINPVNVMGATKRLAEMVIKGVSSKYDHTKYIATRFGNVLGSNGSVVPLFRKQIQKGGPVTVTHPDMVRYFMTIPEACQLVMEASVMGKGGEVFVFDMGKPIRIIDLAKSMIRLAGFIPDVDIKIEISGKRPGEKLYEDLFSEKEKIMKTYHEKIMISKERDYDIEEAEAIVQRLKNMEHSTNPKYYKETLDSILSPQSEVLKSNN